MKLRRAFAAGVSAILLLTLTAVLPSAYATTPLRVGVAYDTGGPGDHSFDDAVVQGLDMAAKRFPIQISATVTIGSDADRELRLRSLVAKDCNPIIAVGSGYAAALKNVAISFPSTQFVIVNDASIGMLNVTSLVFSENQGGYLAGVTAALATRTGKIGLVSTTDSMYASGFTAGAQDVKKNITVYARYGSDTALTLTNDLIRAGTDVIFLTIAGSGSEILKAVATANKDGTKVALIFVEPDQYVTLPAGSKRYILASLVKRVDKAIVNVISESVSGRTVIDVLDAKLGIYGRRYGIQNGGIEISLWSPRVSKYRKVIISAAVKASKLSL